MAREYLNLRDWRLLTDICRCDIVNSILNHVSNFHITIVFGKYKVKSNLTGTYTFGNDGIFDFRDTALSGSVIFDQ